MASPTIVDIARLAGVSFKTVARVINHEPAVKPETRERVEAVIARLNYRPNVWARTLRSSRTHLIGLIFAYPRGLRSIRSPYNASLQRLFASSYYMNQTHIAAMSVCQRLGYHLFMEEEQAQGRELERRAREIIKSTQLDGVLLAPPLADDLALLKLLDAEDVSFVRLEPTKYLDVAPYVYMDDRKAAYEETKLLCDLGHRAIGFIKGPKDHGSSELRYGGFEDAMKERGLPIKREWCTQIDYSNAKLGMEAGDILLTRRPRPTAIFAFNDEVAIGVISAALRRGLRVPEDISIVGFDDSPLASMFWPGLTTIHHPIAEMTQRACEMLIEKIESKDTQPVVRFDFDIIRRETTTAPPGDQNRGGVRPGKRGAASRKS